MTAIDYISDDLKMTWATHEGNDAIFFGKHPWQLFNRLNEAKDYQDGAAGLMVDLLAFVIRQRAVHGVAGQEPGQLRIEWIFNGSRKPKKETRAFMAFLPPTLANIARCWGVTELEAQTILITQMAGLVTAMAVQQFGNAVFSEWRH